MNGRFVAGLTPWIAMRNLLDQPAIVRSGHDAESAFHIASAMSCAQWLVHSVTGAGSRGQTTVPWVAFTLTGRNVPSFFGVRGSIRYANAMWTADIVFGHDELMKPLTCG